MMNDNSSPSYHEGLIEATITSGAAAAPAAWSLLATSLGTVAGADVRPVFRAFNLPLDKI